MEEQLEGSLWNLQLHSHVYKSYHIHSWPIHIIAKYVGWPTASQLPQQSWSSATPLYGASCWKKISACHIP